MTSTSPILDPAEFADLSKTVLKLSDREERRENREERKENFPRTPFLEPLSSKSKDKEQTTAVLAAMTRLVEIVAELRSPLGGWPADLPKTSENLVPYVLEEACDVLDACKESGSRGAEEQGSRHRAEEQGSRGAGEQRCRGAEEQRSRGAEENFSPLPMAGPPAPPFPAPLMVVDDLIPRLLWHLVSSSYDVMQLIGGVPAQVVRSRSGVATLSPKADPDAAKSEIGLIRLVVSLSVWNSDHDWAIDLATHNVTVGAQCLHPSPETLETEFLDLSADFWHKLTQKPGFLSPDLLSPISAGQLLAKLQQEIEFTSPELAKLMEPRSVEWLQPNHQWLTGFLQLKMDWEFLPQSPENSPEPEGEGTGEPATGNLADISESFPLSGFYGQQKIRLTQPAIFQESAKIPFQEALIGLLPQIQTESETGLFEETRLLEETAFLTGENESPNSNLISQVVKTAYDLVENWEFPWGDGEVLLDECMQRLLWQTITSSYPVMQLIGSVEAMVLSPGEDWKIGILRLLAIFEIQVENEIIPVDLSTGQSWEQSQDNKVLPLSPNTIVRFRDSGSLCESPNTQLSMQLSIQPVMAEDFLNTLSQQIQANTPSFQWLMNGVEIDVMNAAGIWESGLGKLRLELEFIPA